jgi:uncharacterized membrane protein YedE/YeeE
MITRSLPAVVALAAGTLFGLGLALGGMTDPARVRTFLDIAGSWDPTLAFVMGGAVCVTLPLFALARKIGHPWLAQRFQWPDRKDIDRNLILGAILFGIGWALAGLCPGPAIALTFVDPTLALPFLAAMAAGMWAADRRGGK